MAEGQAQAQAGTRAQAQASQASDAPTVAAHLDKAEGRVGDVFVLTVTTVGLRAIPTNLPTQLELAPFEVVGAEPALVEEKDLGNNRVSRRFQLRVSVYETGELTLPPVDVTWIDQEGQVAKVKTAPVPVKIVSLLANEPNPQLKEASGPVTVLRPDYTLAYLGGGVIAAALGAALAMVIHRRIKARAAIRPAPPPRPPHQIALEKLDHLARTGFGPDADMQRLYFQLSEVLREYLGARFAFRALEMTTEELVDRLSSRATTLMGTLGGSPNPPAMGSGGQSPPAPHAIRGVVVGEIAGWLASCDLVKFAKLQPAPGDARGALETAIRIVESTRPRPPSNPVAAPPAVEAVR
jgi:hypothetical protein